MQASHSPDVGGQLLARISTIVLTLCAVAMTGAVVWREFRPKPPEPPTDFVENWREYASEGHRIGPADAKVVLVEFSDYQCPYCWQFEQTIRSIRERYPNEFALVYRHFPVARHAHAEGAAIASECAARQGRFAEMHAQLFNWRDSVGVIPWKDFARAAGVGDEGAFVNCLGDTTAVARIAADREAAQRVGVRGTPMSLLNGRPLRGAVPASLIDSLVRNLIAGDRAQR